MPVERLGSRSRRHGPARQRRRRKRVVAERTQLAVVFQMHIELGRLPRAYPHAGLRELPAAAQIDGNLIVAGRQSFNGVCAFVRRGRRLTLTGVMFIVAAPAVDCVAIAVFTSRDPHFRARQQIVQRIVHHTAGASPSPCAHISAEAAISIEARNKGEWNSPASYIPSIPQETSHPSRRFIYCCAIFYGTRDDLL